MGLDWIDIGVKTRKFVIAIRKFACNHPFLVGGLFCLILLYRSFPFLFSLLLSASPVLVCTAVLLGTLLSFGQPNIPEVEIDDSKLERASHDGLPLKTEISRNEAVVLEKIDESLSVDRYAEGSSGLVSESYTERSRDLVLEKSSDEPSPVTADINNDEIGEAEGSLLDHVTETKELVAEVTDRDLGLTDFQVTSKLNQQKLDHGRPVCDNEYSAVKNVDGERHLDLENDKLPQFLNSFDSSEMDSSGFRPTDELNGHGQGQSLRLEEDRYANAQKLDEGINLESQNNISPQNNMQRVGLLDSPPCLQWKQNINGVRDDGDDEDDDEDEDNEDLTSDSGSDRAESSSPDASMADIIPMLDELHPLLDREAPSHPAHQSHEGYSAVSAHSSESVGGSDESDDGDSEIAEELEGGDEDNDDEEEEETLGDKENGAKDAISWTEDDQKNLMDLGSSELERNQRLESLIARRKLRKSMKLMGEINLIDLDGTDLSFSIAPISTIRKNPFDLPHDSNDNMGLPRIPGSAPSIMAASRNPFDLPYDSGEEKPDLKEDSFQHEFMAFQPRETFFQRHESFNVGPLFLGHAKHERGGSKLKPIFVPERMEEGTSSFPSFQRQSGELSDSKVSSVPDTESVSSDEDIEHKKLIYKNVSQDLAVTSTAVQIPDDFECGISNEFSGSSVNLDHQMESIAFSGNVEGQSLNPKNISMESELTSKMENASEYSAHRILSSDNVNSAEPHEVNDRVIEVEGRSVEISTEKESSLSEGRAVAGLINLNELDISLNPEAAEQSSNLNDNIFTKEEEEKLASPRDKLDDLVEGPGTLTQTSPVESKIKGNAGLVVETHYKEPVFDLSPSSVEKTLPTSISSDLQGDMYEMNLPPVVIKRTISSGINEYELIQDEMEREVGHNTETPSIISLDHVIGENKFMSSVTTEISVDPVKKIVLPVVEEIFVSVNASVENQIVLNHGTENDTLGNEETFPDSSELLSVREGELGSRDTMGNQMAEDVVTSSESVESSYGSGQDTTCIKEILEADLIQLHDNVEDKMESTGVTEITEDFAIASEISADKMVGSKDALMVAGILDPNFEMKDDILTSSEISESLLHVADEIELQPRQTIDVTEHAEVDANRVSASPATVVHNPELADSLSFEEMLTDSSQLHPLSENEMFSFRFAEITEHDAKKSETMGANKVTDSADALMLSESFDPNDRNENDSLRTEEMLIDLLELHSVGESESRSQGVSNVIEHDKVVVDTIPEVAVSFKCKEIVESDSLHGVDGNKFDSTGDAGTNENDAGKSWISEVDSNGGTADPLFVSETPVACDGTGNYAPSNEENLGETQATHEAELGSSAAANVAEHTEIDKIIDGVDALLGAPVRTHEMKKDIQSTEQILSADSSLSDTVGESKMIPSGFSETEHSATDFGISEGDRTADCANEPMLHETSETKLSTENDIHTLKQISADLSEVHAAVENELQSGKVTEICEHDVKKLESTMANRNSEYANTTEVHKSES